MATRTKATTKATTATTKAKRAPKVDAHKKATLASALQASTWAGVADVLFGDDSKKRAKSMRQWVRNEIGRISKDRANVFTPENIGKVVEHFYRAPNAK